ncbi:MAG: glycosyltransferase family 2 protein [Chitinivibrionales bacterium]|nr:glycosyltransferase family 2 protein [Chitinivibrionales bacterium]
MNQQYRYDLSIIIVNWNTEEMLKNCLQSILDTKQELSVQIVVVDNNSHDGSRDMVSQLFPSVELYNSGANIGFARANNLGLTKCGGEFILFLNPDTIICPNALQTMLHILKNTPTIALIGPMMRCSNGDIQTFCSQLPISPLLMQLLQITLYTDTTKHRYPFLFKVQNPVLSGFVERLCGGCIMVRRRLLDQHGSFDERFFMYSEDMELSYRMRKAGFKNYYCSTAEIIHIGGGASEQQRSAFAIMMWVNSASLYIEKYHGTVGKAIYLSALFCSSIIKYTLASLRHILGGKTEKKNDQIPDSRMKHMAILKWILKLDKPHIKQ